MWSAIRAWWSRWSEGVLVTSACALAVVIVTFLLFQVFRYDRDHHCHGNGSYYTTVVCYPVGKAITCVPILQEETVCDR